MRRWLTDRRIVVVAAVLVGIVALGVRQLAATLPPGPFAIVTSGPGSDDARTEGILEITLNCMALHLPDDTRAHVIWADGTARWDEAEQVLVAIDSSGADIFLRDGDRVALTGSGGPAAEIDRAGSWLRRVDPSCEAPEWFVATSAQRDPS